jgi:hypothetical protein
MELRREKFVSALINCGYPTFNASRHRTNYYKSIPHFKITSLSTVESWNTLLWNKIIEYFIYNYNTYITYSNKDNIHIINKQMLHILTENICSNAETNIIFQKLDPTTKFINYTKFNYFLERVTDQEYDNIMNSLVLIPNNEQTNNQTDIKIK